MKRILLLIAAAIVIAACNSTPISDEESKRRELQNYKQQVTELQEKIEVLESELSGVKAEDAVEVSVTELNSRQFEHFIEVTGLVEADLDITVSPESAGVIEEIRISEGQQVSAGQVLGKLNTESLERSLEELKIQYELAQTSFKRQQNLWDQNIGSEMQYLEAKSSMESLEKRIESVRAQIRMSEIKSPVNGVVDILYQKEGEMGSPQIPFAKVLNISKIRVYADVSEAYIGSIERGDTVNISFPALNMEMKAPISRIGSTIDPNNRTFRVRIDINNPGNRIKPNLMSIVQFRNYVANDAIVVPTMLIKEDFQGKYTFIAESGAGNARAKKVRVETGMTQNNRTQVTEGLSDGMKIISEGYNQVSDGTLIQY